MKKTLSHLPKNKSNELKEIVPIICKECSDVEMIILFGSYARGDWKEEADLKPERKSGHKSDYDILVVTSEKTTAVNTGLWNSLAEKMLNMALSAHPRIIAHDIQALNIKLAEGQYFYTDVKKEGCLLYDSGNFKLARQRKLKPEEQKRIAREHYDHWFNRAKDFWFTFEKCFETERYKLSAFNLHQTAESSYKTISLVFTNYNPNEHLLGLLGSTTEKYDPALEDLFPHETAREKNLFKLLDYAYIGARYDADYHIDKDELEFLSERVKVLLEITEKICKAKINGFG